MTNTPETALNWLEIQKWYVQLRMPICHCLICEARKGLLETLWPELKDVYEVKEEKI
jgi:hypothetical protein